MLFGLSDEELPLDSRNVSDLRACCGLVVSTSAEHEAVSIKSDKDDPASRGFVTLSRKRLAVLTGP